MSLEFVLFTKSGSSRWVENTAWTSKSQSNKNLCKDVWEEMMDVTVQRDCRYIMREYSF